MNFELLVPMADELVAAAVRMHDAGTNQWIGDDGEEYDAARRQLLELLPVGHQMAQAIRGGPEPSAFLLPSSYDGQWWVPAHDAALWLRGTLRRSAALADALASDGPVLATDNLHRWVWEPASSLWADGHERSAIHAAASQVEAQLQAKVGRDDVSGAALVREAFSLDAPAQGKARLRFPFLAEGSEEFVSSHAGAGSFGAGCFMIIRNSAAHGARRRLRQVVHIEHLTALSFLARLIDSATVVRSGAEVADRETDAPFG